MGSHGSDVSKRQNVRTSTASESGDVGRIDVEIFGQKLSIRSDRDPEFVENLASYIDETLGELRGSAPQAPTDKLLIMASLTVAEELFEARSEAERLREEVGDRAATMKKLLAELDD